MNGQTHCGCREKRMARPGADAKRTRAQPSGGFSGVAGDLRTRPPRIPRRAARMAHCATRARQYPSADRRESAYRRVRYGDAKRDTMARATKRGRETCRPTGRQRRTNAKTQAHAQAHNDIKRSAERKGSNQTNDRRGAVATARPDNAKRTVEGERNP